MPKSASIQAWDRRYTDGLLTRDEFTAFFEDG
jgi:hypothetical protein